MFRDAQYPPPRPARPTAAGLKIIERRCERLETVLTAGATRRLRLGAIPATAHDGGAAAGLERARYPDALSAAHQVHNPTLPLRN